MDFDGLDEFKTNDDAEAGSGVRLDFGRGKVFIVRRAGGANTNFERAKARITKPYLRQIDAQTIDENELLQLIKEIYVESVIIGWEGITSGGKPVPFNKENALALFDDSRRDLFLTIKAACEDMATFRKQEIEEDAEKLGNS